ncbi:MAG TPA: DUF1549 and DUF1553 domain-containing protein, partial [Planctomycetaceae bacterium]|nr:DUF1549 and DUF1553 domain-containing protein [Planctomycetaceae bacterium]
LIGLPPTAEQVQAFVADPSVGAWERLLDELLQSPHYGERWARHWLDAVGYADSDGVTQDDRVRPYAYKYRDYVVKVLNADKPFNEFLVEQLAGDELVPPPHTNLAPEQIDKLIATGYLRMAADGTAGGVDQDLARNQVMTDTIRIVSTSLLGLSVACAQCHDHRYDPIPQHDYYALRAVFEPALDWKTWQNPQQRLVSLYTDADRAKAAEVEQEVQTVAKERNEKQTVYMGAALEKELEKHPAELRDRLREAAQTPKDKRSPEQQQLLKERPSVDISPGVLYQYDQAAADDLKKFDTRIAEIRTKKPPEDFISPLTEPAGHQPVTYLFHRGDYRQQKSAVAPGDLQIAIPDGAEFAIPADDPQLPTTGRRLAYAKWLTNGRHPLLARVLVNRFWMHHFGRGLVGTPGDFGKLGEQPTHPELLDWLADEFMARGWSLKTFHKQVMMSAVYQQSARRDTAKDAVDADNLLLGRMSVRRLDAESIRDRILAVNGTLSPELFGPPVGVKPDDTGMIVVDGNSTRRSLYIQQRRSQPVALMTTFDAPVMEVNCERRPSSTVAGQALLLMNNEFLLQQSRVLAERVRKTATSVPTLPPELATGLQSPESAWQYGRGRYDEGTARVAEFHRLPQFVDGRWQGGPSLPAAETGWVSLHAQGGHTGENPDFAAVRRWTAPHAGVLSITGELQHLGQAGDGVRGRLVSSRSGLLGEWAVYSNSAATTAAAIEVQPGDTIDFITDCRENVTTDSFVWTSKLSIGADARKVTWDSVTDFRGEVTPSSLAAAIVPAWRLTYSRDPDAEELLLAAWFLGKQLGTMRSQPAAERELQALTNLCQQLLGSNEFLYVD